MRPDERTSSCEKRDYGNHVDGKGSTTRAEVSGSARQRRRPASWRADDRLLGARLKLEYVDELAPEDQVFESSGVKIIVDPKSLAYIDGTELDFAREGLNEGFRFNNPNVKDECGCGESFRV
jgi:hypothetical protein